MAISSVRIHPAIGVARVGNSPDEFFLGPERRWERPAPSGGFKDAQCRVKRQGARFRVFAYNDDGTVDEITAADADITWTVHLANRKAVTRNSGSAGDLTVNPGSRTVDGPNQRKLFDNGQIKLPGASAVTVPLGEVRTDQQGRLVVLGGFGKSASPSGQTITSFLNNAGWYDDVSDGPVTAKVKFHGSGDEVDAAGAWVIVGPPKFSPHAENVVTLFDTIFQVGVDQGWLTATAVPSYTNDIYPILQRARDTQWMENVPGFAHAWADPVYDPAVRQAIFSRLANPNGGGSNMPRLNQATLTKTQYAAMQMWKDGNFVQDWAGPPGPGGTPTPAEIDRAALDGCVGAAFYPGIEAGGIAANPIVDPARYVGASDPMRLAHAGAGPGSMGEFMALPWQADFMACGTEWWPVPRPNSVTVQGTATRVAWARDVLSYEEMVNEWHTLGFVVEQGAAHVEVEHCDTTFITLLTPHLDFQDVPQGPMGIARKLPLAIAFEVRSPSAAVTLEHLPGSGPANARLALAATSTTVGPTPGNGVATARLWLVYETGAAGEFITDQLTIRHPPTGQTWTVTVTASTVPRLTAATALVLDRSGSMSDNRGDGQTKHQSLKEAAAIFVDVMLEGDAVGLVRYNQDAQPLQPLTVLGAADDPLHTARQDTKNVVNGAGLNPDGATSIGDGIFEGRLLLDAGGAGYDVKALVVLTDGLENRDRRIADVAGQINERTYAVGLGTPQNTSAPALQALAGNHGGYMLVTGAITGDNQFILQKYFLQILAGISNADIVLDPDGVLIGGHEQRIPFLLTDADAGADVILLTKHPAAVDFRLQTPNGFILEPWRARAEPSMRYVLSDGVTYYRIGLPVELFPARFDQAGRWHALLTIGRPRLSRPEPAEPTGHFGGGAGYLGVEAVAPFRRLPPLSVSGPSREIAVPSSPPPSALAAASTTGRGRLPYSLLVHTYSSLSFRATLRQSGFEPGARVSIGATLAEAGLPGAAGTHVWVEITRPDNSQTSMDLAAVDTSEFAGEFNAGVPGVYRCRVRATGRTTAGYPFTREQTLTAAVWLGGDRDADPGRPGGPLVEWLEERDAKLCELLRCLLSDGGLLTPELQRRLRDNGIDGDRLRRCLSGFCQPGKRGATDG